MQKSFMETPSAFDRSRPRSARVAMRRFALLASIGLANIGGAASAENPSAAIFDLDFLDTSPAAGSGEHGEEMRRLALVTDTLRRMLSERGVAAIDLTPARERIQKAAPLTKCNGCELDLARDLGAELAVTGLVQKVSNLILNINVAVREVGSGRTIRAGSVDIRGNTDESWLRGMSYLVRNRLSDPPIQRSEP
jgi:hypothetical protein